MTNYIFLVVVFVVVVLQWPSPLQAFTLKLLHRDSPLSPLYQPNLTASQRFLQHAAISQSRAALFAAHFAGIAAQNASIRLPAKLQDPIFTVEIGVGTPAVKTSLIFDTGSGLTWLQCRPCLRCFKQNNPIFDPKKSATYKTINKKHPLAGGFTCTPFGCGYHIGYYSGQFSAGRAAAETFTFHSSLRAPATVTNLVFGCGATNVGKYPPEVAGILGMDKEPTSFVRQLGSAVKSRFSYCIHPKTTSYVRFGDEARLRGRNGRKTPFLITRSKMTSILYTLDLTGGISVNGRLLRVGFPDGCIIDSGASVSLLHAQAYAAVKDYITNYFAKYRNVERYVGSALSKKFLCYKYTAGFGSFPSMTFHFKGADFYVWPQNLFFFVEGNVFCLAMMESKDVSILGAFQQRNVRVVYDLKEKMLSFAPEECSRDYQLPNGPD